MGDPLGFNPKFSTSYGQDAKLSGNLFKGRGEAEYNFNDSTNMNAKIDVFKKRAGISVTNTDLGNTTFSADTKGNFGANTNFDVGDHGNVYGYLNANVPNASLTAGVGYKTNQLSMEAFYNGTPDTMKNPIDINTSNMKFGFKLGWNFNAGG